MYETRLCSVICHASSGMHSMCCGKTRGRNGGGVSSAVGICWSGYISQQQPKVRIATSVHDGSRALNQEGCVMLGRGSSQTTALAMQVTRSLHSHQWREEWLEVCNLALSELNVRRLCTSRVVTVQADRLLGIARHCTAIGCLGRIAHPQPTLYKTWEIAADVAPHSSTHHQLPSTLPCSLTNTLFLSAGSKKKMRPLAIHSTYAPTLPRISLSILISDPFDR